MAFCLSYSSIVAHPDSLFYDIYTQDNAKQMPMQETVGTDCNTPLHATSHQGRFSDHKEADSIGTNVSVWSEGIRRIGRESDFSYSFNFGCEGRPLHVIPAPYTSFIAQLLLWSSHANSLIFNGWYTCEGSIRPVHRIAFLLQAKMYANACSLFECFWIPAYAEMTLNM